MDRSNFSLNNLYHGDHMSTDDDTRPKRPKTSADERSVKFVIDALEENHCATQFLKLQGFHQRC